MARLKSPRDPARPDHALRAEAAAAEAAGNVALARSAWRELLRLGPEGALGREATVALARLDLDRLAVRWGLVALVVNVAAWAVALHLSGA